jgi:hypothetical protein
MLTRATWKPIAPARVKTSSDRLSLRASLLVVTAASIAMWVAIIEFVRHLF